MKGFKTYIVKEGDTLSSIAQTQMGEIELWPYLASINQISSPYIIFPGQVLNIDVAEVTAKKKKTLPLGIFIAGGGLIAAAIYWRKDIAKFFNL